MNENYACATCGGPLGFGRTRYCSRECYGLARQKRVAVDCARCGQSFDLRPYEAERANTHYCAACRAAWGKREKSGRKEECGLVLNCYHCGTPVWRPKWRAKRALYTFCCRECRLLGWGSLQRAWAALRS